MPERQQLERMATLMTTLAALSHKINNPLTSLMGRAQMLQASEQSDPYVRNACSVIEESSRRIAEYVRELSEAVKEGREDALAPLAELDRDA